jgi:hypothetical protein
MIMYTFDIGIVTFKKRFEVNFVPLVEDIRKYNSISNILVNINGTLHEEFDEDYRKRILTFSAEHSKVFPFVWTEFRSLAKLWNNCILNSRKEFILILNDDVKINNQQLFDEVQTEINKGTQLFTINNGFSHFTISKNIATKLGFFDERFLGVGNEDTEMYIRYKQIFKQEISTISSSHIKGLESPLVDDYKKILTKFSQFNRDMLNHLLQNPHSFITEGQLYPCETFFKDNKDKL